METMQFGPHDYFGVYSLAPVEQPAPYRGFKILRERPYYLFHIEQRPGFDLPPMIDGQYTKLTTLQAQVDKFFFENPKIKTSDEAYIKKFIKPGRGRPRKPLTPPDEIIMKEEFQE